MAIDYKRYEFRTFEYLVRLEKELEALNIVDERLFKTKNIIATHRFQVAVMGEFKRGKSTFINALLGLEVLPADATPATATLNRVTYGSQPHATIEYKDERRQEIPISELADYVTKLTSQSADNAKKIKQAIVEYPTIFCQNDIDIIDTPGLQDDEEMTAVTIKNIRDVDLAIIAISARFAFSETECSFIVQLLETGTITNLVVIVTYIDTLDLDEREEFLEFLKERIKSSVLKRLKNKYPEGHDIYSEYLRMINELEIFPVSSKQALKAKKTGDAILLEESGIHTVQKELTRLFLTNRRNNVVIKGVGTINAIIEQLTKDASPEIKNINRQLEALREMNNNSTLKECQNNDKAKATWKQNKAQLLDIISEQEELLKNDVCARFIRRLSSIREKSNIAIENALRIEIRESFQHINTQYVQAFVNDVGRKVKEFTAQYKMKDDLIEATTKPQFGWVSSPLPPNKNLLDFNIIEHIKRVVTDSVFMYFTNSKNYLDRIENIVYEEIDKMCNESEKLNWEKIKILESNLQREKTSWEEKKQSLHKIQLEARNMLESFYQQIKQESN